jgi:hypothetical protein
MPRSQLYCTSRGSPIEVPKNPVKPIDCANCGIANRLMRPQLDW